MVWTTAGRIAAATNAKLLVPYPFPRLERGAGRPAVDRVPYVPQQAIELLKEFQSVDTGRIGRAYRLFCVSRAGFGSDCTQLRDPHPYKAGRGWCRCFGGTTVELEFASVPSVSREALPTTPAKR